MVGSLKKVGHVCTMLRDGYGSMMCMATLMHAWRSTLASRRLRTTDES